MPTYEYACDKCGHEFEREQRITEDPVKTCPECKSRKVQRLISATSFVLKGGGWYSDLYSSSKPDGEKKKDGDKSDSTGSDKKSEKSSDTKADKKSSAKSKKSSGKKASD